jgi:aldose 1-epimerase
LERRQNNDGNNGKKFIHKESLKGTERQNPGFFLELLTPELRSEYVWRSHHLVKSPWYHWTLKTKSGSVSVTSNPFGKLSDGSDTTIYTLQNKNGATVSVTDLGAALVSINVPDKNNAMADVLLGHEGAQGYVDDNSYLGFIVGRYGNRIAKGKFSLDGKAYHLGINDGENHLHGGNGGFHTKLWKATINANAPAESVTMHCISPDGDEGYPGRVVLDVTYSWNDTNELTIEYTGTTDAPTILNPTSHGYFNLTGDPRNTILDHELIIAADQFTPAGPGRIPTGRIQMVEGTPFDFRSPRRIGDKIDDAYDQLLTAGGYDHNWVIRNYNKTLHCAATVYEPKSGRFMEVLTDQPGLQFYTGNFLDGSLRGKGGIAYGYRSGLCLEAQHFPDSPNQPHFPSVVLRPGETYRQTTKYRFSTKA